MGETIALSTLTGVVLTIVGVVSLVLGYLRRRTDEEAEWFKLEAKQDHEINKVASDLAITNESLKAHLHNIATLTTDLRSMQEQICTIQLAQLGNSKELEMLCKMTDKAETAIKDIATLLRQMNISQND